MEELKKYPITYKGQKYEVRWEGMEYGADHITVCIYQVTKYIFGIKTYKYIYGNYEYYIKDILEDSKITYDSKDIYIEEIKMLFKLWETRKEIDEEKERIKRSKENALKEWNGVIE